VIAKDRADGLCDLGGGENSESDLVQERLKGVVIFAVDEGDVDGKLGQPDGGIDACETSTEDDYSFAYSVASRHIFGSF
jgi:hypothetical protein